MSKIDASANTLERSRRNWQVLAKLLASPPAFTYYGDPALDGSWRTGIVGANLVHEKRVAGVWVNKSTVLG